MSDLRFFAKLTSDREAILKERLKERSGAKRTAQAAHAAKQRLQDRQEAGRTAHSAAEQALVETSGARVAKHTRASRGSVRDAQR